MNEQLFWKHAQTAFMIGAGLPIRLRIQISLMCASIIMKHQTKDKMMRFEELHHEEYHPIKEAAQELDIIVE